MIALNKLRLFLNNHNIVENFIYTTYVFMMSVIVCICLLLENIDYKTKIEHVSNFILLPIGIIAFILLYFFISFLKIKLKNIKHKPMIIIFISLICLVMQICFVYCYWFKTGWDVGVVINASQISAIDGPIDSSYFSTYSNNLFLVYIFSRIIKYKTLLGINIDSYFFLIIVQCILNWLTGLLLCHCTYKLTKSYKLTLFAYIIYFFLITLSPWVSIPYSDSTGLFFPIFIYWLYSINSKSKYVNVAKWLLIGLFAYFGYKIKPQIVIIVIAIILIEVLNNLIKIEKIKIYQAMKSIILFSIGIFISVTIVASSTNKLNVDINNDLSFGLTHFLMMGMNVEGQGVYFQEDVDFSSHFNSSEERTKNNLIVAKNRIKEMGLLGFVKQMVYKTLINYNDGSYAWGVEGHFYNELRVDTNDSLSPLLKKIYYSIDNESLYHKIWINFVQSIWICVLFFTICVSFKNRNKDVVVLLLSIIGLTIFELIFEARARYLFIYSPVYIIISILGFSNFIHITKVKLKRNNLCTKVD